MRQFAPLVEARRLAHLVVAFGEVGCVAGGLGVQAGGELEVAVLLVEVGGDRVAAQDVLVDVGQRRQPGGRAIGLADGDGPVEPDDRRVGEPEQLVVPLDDLHPVGLLDPRRVGMERGDRRLRLVLAEPIPRQGRLQDRDRPRR